MVVMLAPLSCKELWSNVSRPISNNCRPWSNQTKEQPPKAKNASVSCRDTKNL